MLSLHPSKGTDPKQDRREKMNNRATRLILNDLSRYGKIQELTIAVAAGFNESQISGEMRYFWPSESRNYYTGRGENRKFFSEERTKKAKKEMEKKMISALQEAKNSIDLLTSSEEFNELLEKYKEAKIAGAVDQLITDCGLA